jgi:hypothetical protein
MHQKKTVKYISQRQKIVIIIVTLVCAFMIIANQVASKYILPKYFVRRVSNKAFALKYALIGTIQEGEEFKQYDYYAFQRTDVISKACKPGLRPIVAAYGTGGTHGCSGPMTPWYICTKCGDGVCGFKENACNCQEDCAGKR